MTQNFRNTGLHEEGVCLRVDYRSAVQVVAGHKTLGAGSTDVSKCEVARDRFLRGCDYSVVVLCLLIHLHGDKGHVVVL